MTCPHLEFERHLFVRSRCFGAQSLRRRRCSSRWGARGREQRAECPPVPCVPTIALRRLIGRSRFQVDSSEPEGLRQYLTRLFRELGDRGQRLRSQPMLAGQRWESRKSRCSHSSTIRQSQLQRTGQMVWLDARRCIRFVRSVIQVRSAPTSVLARAILAAFADVGAMIRASPPHSLVRSHLRPLSATSEETQERKW